MDCIYKKYNIDISKLKRDYIKLPLKRKIHGNCYIIDECPLKEDLEYLYIKCNVIRNDLIKYFNCGITTFKRWCRKFNIRKPLVLLENNAKKTIYEKYGFTNYSQTKEYKQYMKENKEWINQKVYNGMKKSGNFGNSISKEEKEIYSLILKKYPDAIHQYKSEKYPFKCDFYIPSLDLYIEYQGFWKHGYYHFTYKDKIYNCHCPYNPKNKIHRELVKYWKNKNSKFYNSAIEIWTISDPLKRETAKKNNLNWIEFFTFEEVKIWLENNKEI